MLKLGKLAEPFYLTPKVAAAIAKAVRNGDRGIHLFGDRLRAYVCLAFDGCNNAVVWNLQVWAPTEWECDRLQLEIFYLLWDAACDRGCRSLKLHLPIADVWCPDKWAIGRVEGDRFFVEKRCVKL